MDSAFRTLLKDGHTRGRFPLRRLDGGRRVLDLSAVASVAPGLHLSVLRDITDGVEAEDALRRSEARFRVMLEKSAELSGERDIHFEYRAVHRDGSLRWIEAWSTNLLDDPNVGALVGNFRDITARKEAEEALRASELRYHRLIEDLPEPVVVHVDGLVAFANEACWRALGFARASDLVGRSILEFASEATRSLIEARMATANSGGGLLDIVEQTFVVRGGGEIHAELKTIPVDYGGKPAMLSTARDISGRVR